MADQTTSSTEETTQDAGPAAGVKAQRQAAGKTGRAAGKKTDAKDDNADTEGEQVETGANAGREGEDDPRDPSHPGNTQDGGEVSRAAGIHPFTVGGPETLHGSFLGNRTDAHKYVVAENDAYIGFIPQYATTPSTKRLWSAGQMVRKDFHDKWNGKAATQAHEAKVLVDYNQPDHEPLPEAESDDSKS